MVRKVVLQLLHSGSFVELHLGRYRVMYILEGRVTFRKVEFQFVKLLKVNVVVLLSYLQEMGVVVLLLANGAGQHKCMHFYVMYRSCYLLQQNYCR